MKEGDQVINKHNGFRGRVTGLQTRMVEGEQLVERVHIASENGPAARMWCNAEDVELAPVIEQDPDRGETKDAADGTIPTLNETKTA